MLTHASRSSDMWSTRGSNDLSYAARASDDPARAAAPYTVVAGRGGHRPAAGTLRLIGDNVFMPLTDSQQRRLLELLREAGGEPVAFAELRAGGIDFPAAVVSELELNGYAIDRVVEHGHLVGVRLVQPERREAPAAPWRPWSRS